MAQITTTKVAEGDAHLVIRVNMLQDQVNAPELTNYTILLPSDLLPPRPNNKPTFRLMQVWYSLVWFDLTFYMGSIAPLTIWTVARDCDSHTDFRSFGGLLDQAVYIQPPVQDSGALSISTNGFATLGSQGTMVLELRKVGA